MAKLIVNPTSSNRREIPLSRTTILTIGRDPSNDLVLPDAMVSRRHAVVEHRGSQFFLRDCSSANGSVVNGDRVSERGAARRGPAWRSAACACCSARSRSRPGSAGKVVPHPSAAPLVCPSCSGEYRRGDLFCRECGAQVAQPSGPPKAVCASCGASVPLPARFCNACGGTLAADGQRVDGARRGEGGGQARHAARADTAAGRATPPRASGSMAMAPAPQSASPAAAARAQAPGAACRPRGAAFASGAASRARRARRASAGRAGSRLAAFVVDTVFVLSGQAVMLAPVGWYWWAREAPRTPADVSFLPVFASVTLVPLALLLGALYHVYFWSVKGATPGKELLDLRVETEDGVSPHPARLRRAARCSATCSRRPAWASAS